MYYHRNFQNGMIKEPRINFYYFHKSFENCDRKCFFYMETSFSIGPSNEKMRINLQVPYSLIVSPGIFKDFQKIENDIKEIPRCSKCSAYFNSSCKIVGNSWECQICNECNSTPIPSFSLSESFEVDLKEDFPQEILAIYFSLSFTQEDLDLIRPIFINFLQSLHDQRFMVFIGCSDSPLSVLIPHQSAFVLDQGSIKYIPPSDFEVSAQTTFPCPILHIQRQSQLDFSKCIFTSSQINSVISTIKNLLPSSEPIPFRQCISIFSLISALFHNNPLHFISITPDITAIPDEFQKHCQDNLIKCDFLSATYSDFVLDAAQSISGIISTFNRYTLGSLLSLCNFHPIYQTFVNARIAGSKYEWKSSPIFPESISNGVIYKPALVYQAQPFVLDLHPNFNPKFPEDNYIAVQIVTKLITYSEENKCYKTIVRITSKKLKVSNDINFVTESVNPNVLLWLWLTRTMSQSSRDVVAGIFRASARIIAKLSVNNEKSRKLAHAVCSLKFLDIESKEDDKRFNSRFAFCALPPCMLSIVPEIQGKISKSLTTIYCTEDAKTEAVDALNKQPFGELKIGPIPEWITAPDQAGAKFLDSLLPE